MTENLKHTIIGLIAAALLAFASLAFAVVPRDEETLDPKEFDAPTLVAAEAWSVEGKIVTETNPYPIPTQDGGIVMGQIVVYNDGTLALYVGSRQIGYDPAPLERCIPMWIDMGAHVPDPDAPGLYLLRSGEFAAPDWRLVSLLGCSPVKPA